VPDLVGAVCIYRFTEPRASTVCGQHRFGDSPLYYLINGSLGARRNMSLAGSSSMVVTRYIVGMMSTKFFLATSRIDGICIRTGQFQEHKTGEFVRLTSALGVEDIRNQTGVTIAASSRPRPPYGARPGRYDALPIHERT